MFTSKLPPAAPSVLIPLSCLNLFMSGLDDILRGLHRVGLSGAFQCEAPLNIQNFLYARDTYESARAPLNKADMVISPKGDQMQFQHTPPQIRRSGGSVYSNSFTIEGKLFDPNYYRLTNIKFGVATTDKLFKAAFPGIDSITKEPLQNRLILAYLVFASSQKNFSPNKAMEAIETIETETVIRTLAQTLTESADLLADVLSAAGFASYDQALFYPAVCDDEDLLILHPNFVTSIARFIDPALVDENGQLVGNIPSLTRNIEPSSPTSYTLSQLAPPAFPSSRKPKASLDNG